MSDSRDDRSRLAGIVAVFVVAAFGSQLAWAEGPKPNVVYIMADELAYFELSCMGHPLLKTPNVDLGRVVGVCADTMLPDERQAQRAYLGAEERRRHADATGRGDDRLDAQARGLRHRRIRQVGLRRAGLDRRARGAWVRRVRGLL